MIDEQEDTKENIVASAIRAGVGLAVPRAISLPGGKTGFIIPEGFQIRDFDAVNPETPKDVSAGPRFEDADSFIGYINRFKGSNTVTFASIEGNSLNAVIDYHSESEGNVSMAGRCTHQARYSFPWSVAWARWRAVDGEWMQQEELGTFLEEMLHTIAEPSGAGLLEVASELKIDRQVKFKSGSRLQSGTTSLVYEEEDQTSGRQGKIEVPENLTLAASVFLGSDPQVFSAKLRYKLNRGEIKFKIDILNRLEGEQTAFHLVVGRVREQTSCPVYIGRAG